MEFAKFAAKALTVLFGIWEAHDQNEAAALQALEDQLAAQRAKNDAALRRKHGQ